MSLLRAIRLPVRAVPAPRTAAWMKARHPHHATRHSSSVSLSHVVPRHRPRRVPRHLLHTGLALGVATAATTGTLGGAFRGAILGSALTQCESRAGLHEAPPPPATAGAPLSADTDARLDDSAAAAVAAAATTTGVAVSYTDRRFLMSVARVLLAAFHDAARVAQLALIFAPAALTLLPVWCATVVLEGVRPGGDEWGQWWEAWHCLLRWSLETAGPAFTKLGQWASTRPDIFPPMLCGCLSRLHSDVPAESFHRTLLTLRESLRTSGAGNDEEVVEGGDQVEKRGGARRSGVRRGSSSCPPSPLSTPSSPPSPSSRSCVPAGLGAVFSHFEEEPVGCGCIAQVHRARLTRPRRGVATGGVNGGGVTKSVRDGIEARGVVDEEGDGEEGSWVAVKDWRRGVAERLAQDLRLIRRIAALAEWIPPLRLFRPLECAEEFSASMCLQIDLRNEAKHLARLGDNFRRRGLRGISQRVSFPGIPRPDLVTDAVLVETFVEGRLVSEYLPNLDTYSTRNTRSTARTAAERGGAQAAATATISAASSAAHTAAATPATPATPAIPMAAATDASMAQARRTIAKIGVEAFFYMVLVDNFVHADLHPGNILITTATSKQAAAADTGPPTSDLSVCFIDAGIVTVLDDDARINFIDLFRAVAKGDGRQAGELMLERAKIKTCTNAPAFVAGMESVVGRVRKTNFRLSEVKIGAVLTDVLTLVQRHQVTISPEFTSLIMGIVILEGASCMFVVFVRTCLSQLLVTERGVTCTR